ncbi:hypothetical protein Micbo1qcDRAFT_167637, partial [Microdochium bolleyi]
MWLLEHGACNSRLLPFHKPICGFGSGGYRWEMGVTNERLGATVTHAVATTVRAYDLLYETVHVSKPQTLFVPDLRDNSDCACGPISGWNPFLYFLVANMDLTHLGPSSAVATIRKRCRRIFSRRAEWFVAAAQYQDAFRYMTFEALSLEHTTCILARPYSDDESDDYFTGEGEQDRFDLFEGIVSELDNLVITWFDIVDRSESDEEQPACSGNSSTLLHCPCERCDSVQGPPWEAWLDKWERGVCRAEEALALLHPQAAA